TASRRLYLTAALTSWDPSRRYNVVPQTIVAVQQSQLAGAFLAAPSSLSTGRATDDAYIWGDARRVGTRDAAVLTQQFVRRRRDGGDRSQGSPLASADIAEALLSFNVLHAFKTRQMAVQLVFATPRQTSTANRELLVGPQRVPLFGRGARKLLV